MVDVIRMIDVIRIVDGFCGLDADAILIPCRNHTDTMPTPHFKCALNVDAHFINKPLNITLP